MVDSGGIWRPGRAEDEVEQVLEAAQALVEQGRVDEAEPYQQKAVQLAYELIDSYPNDSRGRHLLAGTSYELAASLNALERYDDALVALDNAESGYIELAASGQVDVAPQLADVQARRAMTQAHRGYGATAVLEIDSAVITYGALTAGEAGQSLQPDFARVLAMNALILRRYGDADLAVASADAAITLFLQLAGQINESPQAPSYARYLCTASAVAADIHAEAGRYEVALQADEIGLSTADTLADSDSPADLRTLVGMLTRKGRHLAEVGREDEAEACLRSAYATDQEMAEQVVTEISQPLPPTLTSALDLAAEHLGSFEEYGRLRALTEPAQGMTLATVSGRCDPETAALRGVELAALVRPLFAKDTQAALTLGLEAHYLFALSSERQSQHMRYELSTFGPPWAQVLLDISKAYQAAGAMEFAQDLAGSAATVGGMLIPFTAGDSAIRSLSATCFRHNGDLLAANGDFTASEHAHGAARQLESNDL
ncbi:hypothetical protein [Kribbella deserti]|uniref:Tetratricopeptide repeat protein n=1 Tax=Kribbella deserti TaxID=1926257 RepID=A0ABV6QXE3_9ACTN